MNWKFVEWEQIKRKKEIRPIYCFPNFYSTKTYVYSYFPTEYFSNFILLDSVEHETIQTKFLVDELELRTIKSNNRVFNGFPIHPSIPAMVNNVFKVIAEQMPSYIAQP